ncbi:hypothetical protein DMA11_17245 [Marinilabiliaceae bacterium JC017]|nr:hypothetical protein DMA11_17245 [Marinilabiliaceae bacterium JC017]
MPSRSIIVVLFLLVSAAGKAHNRIDSIYNALSLRERLAHLFVCKASDNLESEICKYGFRVCTFDELNSAPEGNSSGFSTLTDISSGFEDGLGLPFPSVATLSRVTDTACVNEFLINSLEYVKLHNCTGLYLGNKSSRNEKHKQFILKRDSDLLQTYNIIPYPEYLLKKLVSPQKLTQAKVKPGSSNTVLHPYIKKLNNVLNESSDDYLISFEEVAAQPVLFYSDDLERDVDRLYRAVHSKMIDQARLEGKIKRLLSMQYALSEHDSIDRNRADSLKRNQIILRKRIYTKSIAGISRDHTFPIRHFSNGDIVVIDLRATQDKTFSNTIALYSSVIPVVPVDEFNPADYNPKQYVFIASDDQQLNQMQTLLPTINKGCNSSLIFSGKTGPLFNEVLETNLLDGTLIAAENNSISWQLLAQSLLGGEAITGMFPHFGNSLSETYGPIISQKTRLSFGLPIEVGMNEDSLRQISDIVTEAIKEKATPGAQILIAKEGKIIYNHAFGYHTYGKKQKVTTSDLYDLASMTKVLGTMPVIMSLCDQGVIDLDAPIKNYLSETDTTNKGDLTINEILLHQAGLPSYIPFYLHALDSTSYSGHLLSRRYSGTYNLRLDKHLYMNKNARYRSDVFQKSNDSVFDIRVANRLYMNHHHLDSMYAELLNVDIDTAKNYRYSDLGYLFLHKIISRVTGKSYEQVFYSTVTEKLHTDRLLFKPLEKYSREEITPTVIDLTFRKESLRGYVHDETAAMLGGVAAHAGLFGNTMEVAIVAQMFLNGGTYGGQRFLKQSTIDYFTSPHNHGNRRGLGFDKPETDPEKSSPASLLVSPESFGHSGFTGTLVWIDPKYDLIYVFLSNRIHPRSYNKKLITTNVRTRIQDVIYHSFLSQN